MTSVAPLRVAVIDGPFDARALDGVLTHEPIVLGTGSCADRPDYACLHGTFIMGLLGARPDAPIPGPSPNLQLLHLQLFPDARSPEASLVELAEAIDAAIAAGAQLINVSLAVLEGGDQKECLDLRKALDNAEAHGAVIVAAAGNQGRAAHGQMLTHASTIPVTAVDARRRPLKSSNHGRLVAERGLSAPGDNIPGYLPGGGQTVMSGTSVAAAMATGMLATVWGRHPDARAQDILAAVKSMGPRQSEAPPFLDIAAFHAALDSAIASRSTSRDTTNLHKNGREMERMTSGTSSLHLDKRTFARTTPVVIPASGGALCTCDARDAPEHTATTFVYVLGSVDVRVPDQSIAAELETVAGTRIQKPNEDLRTWCHRILRGDPGGRYVARQLNWILTVEGEPAYALMLRDSHDLDTLIGCLAEPQHDDLCLFVGTSNLQLNEEASSIALPILAVDQLHAFAKAGVLARFQPSSQTKKPIAAHDLYQELFQSADNFGDTDQRRALNFLAARYAPLCVLCADMVANNHQLKGFPIMTSRLSAWGSRRIVDVVFCFEHLTSGVTRNFFVRVDVTHMFPTIVSHVSRYIERVVDGRAA